jgi:hypothetical protein
MSDVDREIGKLKAQIAKLEARLNQQSTVLSRAMKTGRGCDETLMQFIDLHRSYIDEAFDHITNLERKVFPNLPRDMAALRKVIGDSKGSPLNPLDRRKK